MQLMIAATQLFQFDYIFGCLLIETMASPPIFGEKLAFPTNFDTVQ